VAEKVLPGSRFREYFYSHQTRTEKSGRDYKKCRRFVKDRRKRIGDIEGRGERGNFQKKKFLPISWRPRTLGKPTLHTETPGRERFKGGGSSCRREEGVTGKKGRTSFDAVALAKSRERNVSAP